MKHSKFILSALSMLLIAAMLTACSTVTNKPVQTDAPTFTPTAADVTTAPTTASTAAPTAYAHITPAPFTDYDVMLTLPLKLCNSYEDAYDLPSGAPDWESATSFEMLIPKSEYDGSCLIFINPGSYSKQVEAGSPLLPKSGSRGSIIDWGVYGDGGAYILDGTLFRIYQFSNGELVNTIELEHTDSRFMWGCVFVDGLWYVDYSNGVTGQRELRAFDENSNRVKTITNWPTCLIEGSDSLESDMNLKGSVTLPDGRVLLEMTDGGMPGLIRRYSIDSGSFVFVDEVSVSRDDITFSDSAYAQKMYFQSETGYVASYNCNCYPTLADGTVMDYAYDYFFVGALDANGSLVAGFDAFDYMSLRSWDYSLSGCIKAYSVNEIYMLMLKEDVVQIVRIPLDSSFRFAVPEMLPYTRQDLIDMGRDNKYREENGIG